MMTDETVRLGDLKPGDRFMWVRNGKVGVVKRTGFVSWQWESDPTARANNHPDADLVYPVPPEPWRWTIPTTAEFPSDIPKAHKRSLRCSVYGDGKTDWFVWIEMSDSMGWNEVFPGQVIEAARYDFFRIVGTE